MCVSDGAMENPFIKAAKLLGRRKEEMIEKAERWKPAARFDRPEPQDFPILIWKAGDDASWQVWENDRQLGDKLEGLDEKFVWFSLPKV